MFFNRVLSSIVAVTFAGCTVMTTISSGQPNVAISIEDKYYSTMPISDKFSMTTFGNYEFEATKPGREPFYGILPLRFNGLNLAFDILFFPPSALINLRQVYPYYQFEIEKRVILFKDKEEDGWQEFRPTQAETTRAQQYFLGR